MREWRRLRVKPRPERWAQLPKPRGIFQADPNPVHSKHSVILNTSANTRHPVLALSRVNVDIEIDELCSAEFPGGQGKTGAGNCFVSAGLAYSTLLVCPSTGPRGSGWVE